MVLLWLTVGAASAAPAMPESLLARTPPAVLKVAPEQITAYRNYLEKSRVQTGVPGMAVIIVQPSRILLLEGFGKKSAAADAPVTTTTRFALGPATEAINSLLLTRLAAQDLLDLDAPARRSWDEFKLNDAAATKTVTLRQLLGMTAGLPPRADEMLSGPESTPADLFAIVSQIPVTAQPGNVFDYSDASAAVAGYLAVYAANHHHAPAAGLPTGYAELARMQLFDPLGMKLATYDAPAVDGDDASGHTREGKGPWKLTAPPAKSGGALLPAAGLRLAADDVAAWLQFELSDGTGPDGKSLVSRLALQQRWRPAEKPAERDFGLGWATQHYRGIELVARIGEENHQASLVLVVPQFRTALAVLTNAGGHEAAVFLQDALLNFADLLREASTPPAAK